jgi:RHS repeat-associated protein
VLHQAGTTTLDGASYGYDSAGNRTSKTNNLSGITSTYGYDAIYQLLQVTQGASTTESYSYDAVGNRLSSTGVPSYSYNPSNELTANSSGSYTYDANGNTLSDASGRSFTWDFENRLIQAIVPGTGTVTFKYDPFGRRVQKSGPLGTTNYLYGGANLLEEVDTSGNILARYTHAQGIDEPLAELRSGTTSYYDQDGQGSVSSVSNSAGVLAKTYVYDSFGKLTSSTGTLTNPLQYAARESDSETGLYYNRSRYYDPGAGRWLSEDRIRFFGGKNFCRYVLNNPLRFRDPFGRGQVPDCYPDCVNSQQQIQQMQQEHDQTMQQILGPDQGIPDSGSNNPPPPPPPAKPCSSESACAKWGLADAWVFGFGFGFEFAPPIAWTLHGVDFISFVAHGLVCKEWL